MVRIEARVPIKNITQHLRAYCPNLSRCLNSSLKTILNLMVLLLKAGLWRKHILTMFWSGVAWRLHPASTGVHTCSSFLVIYYPASWSILPLGHTLCVTYTHTRLQWKETSNVIKQCAFRGKQGSWHPAGLEFGPESLTSFLFLMNFIFMSAYQNTFLISFKGHEMLASCESEVTLNKWICSTGDLFNNQI